VASFRSVPMPAGFRRHVVGQGSHTRSPLPRNYFVRLAAMSTKFKIFWIKTTCIIHFTRKNIIRRTYLHLRRFPATTHEFRPNVDGLMSAKRTQLSGQKS